MQNGRYNNLNMNMNMNYPMNFHHETHQFPSPNPPIYTTFQPQQQQQFHHHLPPPPLPYNHVEHSDYEQTLKDEVFYLHSLWHRGPPPRNPHPHPLLKPSPTTPFKKKSKKPLKPYIDSGKEWVLDPKPPPSSPPTQGWGQPPSRATPKFRPPCAQEQDRVLAVRVHLRGLDSSVGFFQDSDDEEYEDDDEEECDYDEEEVFELFMKVFEEDEGLRGYYKIKFHNGEFYCLVCGVVGNKLGRKYKDCVALVQHSVTISKTKKRVAHRAYGRAVCKVLGWDIDRLPALPLTLSLVEDANLVVENQSSLELEKSDEPPQGENKDNVDGPENKPALAEGDGDPTITNDSQAEPGNFPDATEKENVSRVDNGCTADERRDSGENFLS